MGRGIKPTGERSKIAKYANGSKYYGFTGRRVDAGIPQTWKWANGKKPAQVPEPKYHKLIHGRRQLGSHDISDVPTDFDVTLAMPLPWQCECGNVMMRYAYFCGACDRLTPLGYYSQHYENWWRS